MYGKINQKGNIYFNLEDKEIELRCPYSTINQICNIQCRMFIFKSEYSGYGDNFIFALCGRGTDGVRPLTSSKIQVGRAINMEQYFIKAGIHPDTLSDKWTNLPT